MVNPLSRFLTPLEPVAWNSSHTAATLAVGGSPHLSRLWRCFKTPAWMCLYYAVQDIAITLGWPPVCWFPSTVDKFRQPFQVLHKSCPGSRAGYSYSQFTYKTSPLLLPLIISGCILFSARVARAEAPAATTPTRLVIPAIGLDSVVVPVGWKKVEVDGQTYGQWDVDDNLVGWHNLSASLGQAGNSVLNGHSNIHGKVFRNLNQVEIGDIVVAFTNNQTYRYVVTAKVLVREKGVSTEKRLENAKFILPTEDERLTLITCMKPGASHRLIVIAMPEISHR